MDSVFHEADELRFNCGLLVEKQDLNPMKLSTESLILAQNERWRRG